MFENTAKYDFLASENILNNSNFIFNLSLLL